MHHCDSSIQNEVSECTWPKMAEAPFISFGSSLQTLRKIKWERVTALRLQSPCSQCSAQMFEARPLLVKTLCSYDTKSDHYTHSFPFWEVSISNMQCANKPPASSSSAPKVQTWINDCAHVLQQTQQISHMNFEDSLSPFTENSCPQFNAFFQSCLWDIGMIGRSACSRIT